MSILIYCEGGLTRDGEETEEEMRDETSGTSRETCHKTRESTTRESRETADERERDR